MTEKREGTVWERFFRCRLLTPFAAAMLALLCAAGTAAACLWRPAPPRTDEELYRQSVLDAMIAEEDEVFPLVALTPESGLADWKDGRVLLATIHGEPELYPQGTAVALPGEVWIFTSRELAAWYADNHAGVEDWPLRLKQLVGVPPDAPYTHITAFWAQPADVSRPAYITDVTSGDMPTVLPENAPEEYRDWFNGNILWSYFDSAYPWTRLGYTYDWAAGSGEYGLTEFLVRPGASVEVAYTDSIGAFIDKLESGR